MRDSSIFYRSFYEALKDLPAENQAELYTAIFEYSLNFNEVELTGLSNTIFKLIKPQLKANNKKYENGKKGGAPGKENKEETNYEPKNNQNETKEEPNVNGNENENLNENVNENKKPHTPTTFSFYKSLISIGAESKLANEWLAVRKKKKATDTETAFDGFVREMNKGGLDINSTLRICIEKSWSGLNASWLKGLEITPQSVEGETSAERSRREYIENYKNIKIH